MFHGRTARHAILACAISLVGWGAHAKVEFIPGEFVVKLKSEFTTLSHNTLANALGGEVKERLSEESRAVLISRPVIEKSEYAIQALEKSPLVEYAEPNYIYRTNRVPNDPQLGQLWGMINTGQEIGRIRGRENMDIDADKAWDITVGDSKVIVAVIDTGVDYRIPDLAPNMWINMAEKNGQPNVDDDGNGFVDDIHGYDFVNNDGDPRDDHGHGSHVSGTIGGRGDDGQGVVGVAWNVSIMGIKFLSAGGSGSLADAVKSIDYATQMGANIMSNSWGGGGFSDALKESIERAKNAGILFIAAAGNHAGDNDADPSYPANYEVDNVISVASINNRGELSDFSCFGAETVHLAAPGEDVLSTTPAGFDIWSGTSMATPHVSGVAALVMSHEPEMTYLQVKERMMATAKITGALRGKVKAGLVNAYHSLTNTEPERDPEDPYYWEKGQYALSSPHPYGDKYSETWTVHVPGVTKLSVFFSKFETESGYDTVTFKDAKGQVVGVWSGTRNNSYSPAVEGDTITITFKTDDSVTRYGFDISGVAFQSATTLTH